MLRASVVAVALVVTQGCAPKKANEPFVFMLSDFMSAKKLPYDSPPQVIYRIDDHRFVTLEHYRDCNHGETFYNDTRAGIRQQLGRGDLENYQGKLINADPTGRNLAFPAAAPPHLATNDRGWAVALMYSTDGGKTFGSVDYMEHSFDPYEDSKDYAVFVTKDRLYVANRSADNDAYVVQYPMVANIDLSKPYPNGISGASFAMSKRPGIFLKLRTPSGQDRLTCDQSIKPTNPDAALVP
ncbi:MULTISPECIES: T6SS immunity protein Tli3 family protein [Burkholderia cepacia complex]|uniref:T6SS immunity protein Tli3 family protein n=1 Tax=Burkholderia stagnalis TaxID=1503054 RepID=UPI000F809B98